MPPGITIVGLGPGPSSGWTQAALTLLLNAGELFFRTTWHSSAAEIPAKIFTFDELYDQVDDVNLAHDRVATEIVRLGQREAGVVYAVPGHPQVDDPTVPRIRTLAAECGLPLKIIPGLSLLESTLTVLNLAARPSLQLTEAVAMLHQHHPALVPDRPALIFGVNSRQLAERVKVVLLNAYSESLTLTLVQNAGTELEQIWTCRLSELDQQPRLEVPTSLYLPVAPGFMSLASFQETIAHLRAPEGCPWDRAQTHQSLRPFLLEETYEVLEALDENDPVALAEELGDLLLMIALQVQIARELGEFKMGEVIQQINRKLLRRHPHVFGNTVVNGVKDILTNWEAIKKMEKAETNRAKNGQPAGVTSALAGVPRELPALAQALVISKKAVQVGFEWPDIEGVLDKLIEEAREITEATDPVNREAEVGDLFFSAVNLARWLNIDPESALRAANTRFTRRFQKMEVLATHQGKTLPEMSIEEMDILWNEAKRLVK